jgi:hypothetical protein
MAQASQRQADDAKSGAYADRSGSAVIKGGTPGRSNRDPGASVAAATGAGLKDLMARMGHDSEHAAMIYQHEARGADAAITGGIDAHVQAERGHEDDGDDGAAGVLVPAG